jgi:hypothetical protein
MSAAGSSNASSSALVNAPCCSSGVSYETSEPVEDVSTETESRAHADRRQAASGNGSAIRRDAVRNEPIVSISHRSLYSRSNDPCASGISSLKTRISASGDKAHFALAVDGLFCTQSCPSRGDPCGLALGPTATSTNAVGYGRFTSKPDQLIGCVDLEHVGLAPAPASEPPTPAGPLTLDPAASGLRARPRPPAVYAPRQRPIAEPRRPLMPSIQSPAVYAPRQRSTRTASARSPARRLHALDPAAGGLHAPPGGRIVGSPVSLPSPMRQRSTDLARRPDRQLASVIALDHAPTPYGPRQGAARPTRRPHCPNRRQRPTALPDRRESSYANDRAAPAKTAYTIHANAGNCCCSKHHSSGSTVLATNSRKYS